MGSYRPNLLAIINANDYPPELEKNDYISENTWVMGYEDPSQLALIC